MPESARTSSLVLRAVTATTTDGTRVLDDVSFSAEKGQLVSIVGPTGAGKTSLARVIAGSLPATSGERFVDGEIAFVPQHDTLHMGLTLRRALDYAAALRVADADKRDNRVVGVIAELGLERHADTVVRDLSVGQRKRATVAAQLLGDPDVVVLDEPTAGLDPGYERVVRDMLRALADAGRTVVTVTHSVDTLQASDRVLFLASGGTVAFFGTPKEAATYFGSKDPADVFLALDTAPRHAWQAKFRSSPLFDRHLGRNDGELASQPRPRSGGRGVFAQTALLVRRHFELLVHDRRHLALLALQAPVIGALLLAVLPPDGLVQAETHSFSASAAVVVMFVVLSTTWLGITNAVREIVKEQAIVRAEGAAGMTPIAYVGAKAFSVGAIIVVQSIVIALLATARQGAPSLHALMLLVAVAAFSGLAAAALGLAISAWAKSADKALAILPIALVLQLVLAGGWAEDSRMPLVGVARAFVGARWGMAAMEAVLRDNAANEWIATGALVGLVALALVTATWRVRLLTDVGVHRAPARPRLTREQFRLAGAGVAVAASVAAGGTGVFALMQAQPVASIHAAPAPTSTTLASQPPATTPVTTAVTTPPTTAAPATQLAAPPVTAAPKKAVTPVAEHVEESTAVSIPIPRDVPVTVPDTPVVTTPTTVPPVPTTTNPWQTLVNAFNPFAPRADR